jgi:hypothetical protein
VHTTPKHHSGSAVNPGVAANTLFHLSFSNCLFDFDKVQRTGNAVIGQSCNLLS